jgi:hypothetical protein
MAFNEMKKAVKAAGVPAAPPGPSAAGTVTRIVQSTDHPGMARVDIKHRGQPGKVGKSGGHGNLGFDMEPTSSAHIHVENANQLKIGQKVHLRAHDGEYGAGTSDEFTQ